MASSVNMIKSETTSQSAEPFTDSKISDSKESTVTPACVVDHTMAFLVVRLWLATRNILTGIEKFGAYKTIQQPLIDPVTHMEDPNAMLDVKVKYYAFANYSGIPAALKDKFSREPLLPHPLLVAFDRMLGPALIITGLMLLLGLGTRLSLFVQGLLYVALTVGLILIHQDDGISWLGIHVALVALALVLARHNKFAILKKW
jgi:thiosulfate dehydrogenase [quinone] large subunit